MPSREQANKLADETNVAADEQEARAVAIIQQLKDQSAAKDTAISDLNTALEEARANAVDDALIERIQTIKTNLENNFVTAQETADAAVDRAVATKRSRR